MHLQLAKLTKLCSPIKEKQQFCSSIIAYARITSF
jgi:hypothetical protein